MTADRPEDAERWCVVGGGMLGLSLAHRIRQTGRPVTLLEAAPELGGLTAAWSIGDVVWDRYYHVTMASDTFTRGILAELDLDDEMEWVTTRTGCYFDGTMYSVSDAMEFLKFPALNPIDKGRLGSTIVAGSRMTDWKRLERIPVEDWLVKWSGRRTFDRFWLPLLRAKLGEGWQDANAAFIWATIQRLYAARRTGMKTELFGYVPGGYARVLSEFERRLRADGVEIRLGTPAERVAAAAGGGVDVTAGGTTTHYDQVVVTSNADVAARVIDGITDAERRRLQAIRYQGVVCASVLLDEPLSPYYLTYLFDPTPFTAVVEMSAMVDRRHFGGRSLVYLPKYVAPDDPLFETSDADIEESFLGALERIHPSFSRDQVQAFQVARVRRVFSLPVLGYSDRVPPIDTSVPGIHIVNSTQILNGTLNVNETVQLAERAAAELVGAVRPAITLRMPTLSVPPDAVAAEVPAGSGDRPATVPARPASTTKSPGGGSPAPEGDGRPVASLSLDLDNKWTYMKIHGDEGWEEYPSYLDVIVPRALRFFEEREQRITFFVIGQDAALERNHDAIGALGRAGHEVGNHSFRHEPWLHLYERDELDTELARAEDAIGALTGCRPDGFRGPGFSLSEDTLSVLAARGYRYDASTFPTYMGPLARFYYFRSSEFTAEERHDRRALFGPAREGTRSIKPYRWQLAGATMLELPVTTMPVVKVPIHVSYLLYLSAVSEPLAEAYFKAAMRLCRLRGIGPSILLHPLDFLSGEDVPELKFFPGMGIPPDEKVARVGRYLDVLDRHFDVRSMGGHVASLEARSDLPVRRARFFHGDAGRPTSAALVGASSEGTP